MKLHLFVGRCNPPTKTHLSLIRQMAEQAETDGAVPVVVLVAHDEVDERNPLSLETRREILRLALGNFTTVRIITVYNPYRLVRRLLKRSSVELLAHHAGPDRVADYRDWYPPGHRVVEHRFQDGVRATAARDAARRLDTRQYRMTTPEAAWPFMQEIAAVFHCHQPATDPSAFDVVTTQPSRPSPGQNQLQGLFRPRRRRY